MINIPTELLRTLVAVVDLRSFIKAAQSLGVTQPAVSAQIKRLQLLLDCELFDKSAPGVSLTPSGDLLINYARRMLSLNDQIVEMAVPSLGNQPLRVGVPGDFAALLLPPVLAKFRANRPDIRFTVRSQHFDIMSRDLRQGELDLMIGLSESGIPLDSYHQWTEPMVWVRQPGFELDPNAPVPLVSFGEVCALHRAAVAMLNRVQRSFDVVFTGPSEACILAAVKGGLGVSMMARSRAHVGGVEIWEDAPLPALGDLCCGIYLGETGEPAVLEELANAIYEVLGPKTPQMRTFAAVGAAGTIGRY
ncbi:MAG: LysR family transcriptional regulator [Pseudorhodoplanes sp.]